MGDRANFGIKQSGRQANDCLFVYGHWAGYEMMHRFANAVKTVMDAGRVNDESYANRIMIETIIGIDASPVLGWGVSLNYLPDNEHSVPVVDFANGNVALYNSNWQQWGNQGEPKFTMSLEAFVQRFLKR